MSTASESVLIVPPTTVKKKARARRVFGTALLDGEADCSSLCYSLSEEEDSSVSDESTRFSQGDSESGSVSLPLRKTSGKHDDESVATSKASEKAATSTQPNVSFGPFVSIVSEDKENACSISTSFKTTSVCSPRDNSRVQEKLRKMRMKQSPLRRDLVQKTQDAINKASASVNQFLKPGTSVNDSLRAAQKSKAAALRQKALSAAEFRNEWKEDTMEAKAFNKHVEQSRYEALSLHRQLSFKVSGEKAKRKKLFENSKLEKLHEEIELKSESYRAQQERLRAAEDCRRRQSVAAREKLVQNAREGKEKMIAQKVSEEQMIYDERHSASEAQRAYAKSQAEKRRKSYMFRNGDARRIRLLYQQMHTEKLMDSHASFELKWKGQNDASEEQRQMEQDRRDSLAFRNHQAMKQRQRETKRQEDVHRAEVASLQLKMDADRDAVAYLKREAEERRNSLACRGEDAVRQREVMAQLKAADEIAEHESYLLKWDGENDAKAYRVLEAAKRRESFALRNRLGREAQALIDARKGEALAREHESYQLKWEGERDAEQYRRDVERKRRDSFVSRNNMGRKAREVQKQQDDDDLVKAHESYLLKWEGERDAKAYQLLLESERRESLSRRGATSRQQRLCKIQDETAKAAKEHQSYELKWAGERDVKDYEEYVKQQRRESLAMRNKERVGHAKVISELTAISHERETESLALKWAGDNDGKEYLERLAVERRESLKGRGKQTVHEREIESQIRAEKIKRQHEDEVIRAKDHLDIEEYRKLCAERDRNSLQYRMAESRAQRILDKERTTKQEKIDARAFQLDTAARADVEEYLKDCKRRRRLSLAFRAKEKRQQAAWKKKDSEARRRGQSREIRGRLMDRNCVEAARQQERVKAAIDALRHAL